MTEFVGAMDAWGPGLVAMVCLVAASGFFSASETALFYLSHEELRRFRVGGSRQRMVAALLGDADRLLTAVLFWNLLINLLYFATSVVVAHQLSHAGQPAAAGVFSLCGLFGIILFGEVLPKSVAVVFRSRLSTLVVWPLAVAVRLLDAITPALRNVTIVIRRTFFPGITNEARLEPEDLERAVEASTLSEDLVRQERHVLHNVLDLSEIAVEEVMRPRGTYVSLAPPVALADLQGEVPPADYVLVHQEGTEDVQAAIPLAQFSSLPEEHLESVAEDVVHVPWCANLAYTLQLLRERVSSVASVVNEYGETVGIVTYEDLVDTVLMAEPSRARRLLQREPVLEVAEGRYHVEGITTLRYLSRRLNVEHVPTEGQCTLAGVVYEELEHLPEVGDECTWNGFRMKVIEVSRPGRFRVMLWADEQPQPAEESAP